MKRKIIVLALALIVAAIGLVSCGGESSDGGGDNWIVGEWKLTSAEVAGQTLGNDALGGFQYSFTFGEDGKAAVSVMGQSYEDVEYTIDGDKVTFGDSSLQAVSLEKDGDKLVFEETNTGAKLFFEK
jgi:hypothetical protein